jgi:hypothetical protein
MIQIVIHHFDRKLFKFKKRNMIVVKVKLTYIPSSLNYLLFAKLNMDGRLMYFTIRLPSLTPYLNTHIILLH